MTDQAGGDTNPSVQALADLVANGDWRPLNFRIAGHLVYVRLWDEGSNDSLVVQGEDDVLAQRENAYGRCVWRETGTVLDMIDKVTGLPEPGDPDAPRLSCPHSTATNCVVAGRPD